MTLLSAIDGRIDDVLFDGEGTSSPVAQVAAIAIPAGSYRPLKSAPLTDANVPLGEVDRAAQHHWASIATPSENVLHSQSLRVLRLVVRNAVVFGKNVEAYVVAKDGEVEADVITHEAATSRVIDHAEQIAMALTHHGIHGSDTTPKIVSIVRTGETTVTEVAGNRLIATSTFTVTIVRSQSTRYV